MKTETYKQRLKEYHKDDMYGRFLEWLQKLKRRKNKKMELEECECEDLPISYCDKCKSFFTIDKEGQRKEIELNSKE